MEQRLIDAVVVEPSGLVRVDAAPGYELLGLYLRADLRGPDREPFVSANRLVDDVLAGCGGEGSLDTDMFHLEAQGDCLFLRFGDASDDDGLIIPARQIREVFDAYVAAFETG